MNVRGLVAGAARTGAGVWQGVAEAVDPKPPTRPTAVPDSDDQVPPEPGPGTRADALVASGEAMLVPIDSWTRMVDQLANLHEAGRELAEARERAVRAETEATFLRQQLAQTRAGDDPASRASAASSASRRAAEASSVPGRARDYATRTRGWARTLVSRRPHSPG